MIQRLLAALVALALIGPALPQSFDTDGFDTDAFSEDSFWLSGDFVPPEPDEAYTYRNGTAYDANGRMVTEFLGPSEAVPRGASFHEGVARTDAGGVYVAAWPTNNQVRYLEGFATRRDGALIVVLGGTRAQSIRGIAVSSRGETLVTEDPPTRYIEGVGVDAQGRISVTNGN